MQVIEQNTGTSDAVRTGEPSPLNTATDARKACCAVWAKQMEIIDAERAGIVADRDPEALHRYRVAIRRTRALLSPAQDLFAAEAIAPFVAGWRDWGRLSNRQRDLDVMLIHAEEYRARLGDQRFQGLIHTFAEVKSIRMREHKKVIKRLNSRAYADFLGAWKAFLNAHMGSTGGAEMGEILRIWIRKRYQKIHKHRRLFCAPHASAADLHGLRLHGKKLRYLLELFPSLVSAKPMLRLLQKLQNALGTCNDLSHQQIWMEQLLQGKSPGGEPDLRTKAALIGLARALNRQKKGIRKQIARLAIQLTRPRMQKVVKKLVQAQSGNQKKAGKR